MEEILQVLYHAAQQRQACRLVLRGEPVARVVHPYGVCRTARNRVVLVCWQALGFTKAGGRAGYRQLELARVQSAEMLTARFQVDPGFNPQDGQYKEWVYHV